MHYVDGQCVYVYKIQFARCKPCDGQNRGCRCYKPMEPPGSRDTSAALKGNQRGGNMTAQAGDSCPCRYGRVEHA